MAKLTRLAALGLALLSFLHAASPRERIEALRSEIAHHDALYFKHAAPEISDTSYDALKRELRQLEQLFPDAARSGPRLPELTDDRTAGFSRARHGERMLSLNKAYSEAEVREFVDRTAARLNVDSKDLVFVAEPKFDGVAISVTYEHGELTRAVTRGNGTEGDVVTANVRAIRELPHRLNAQRADGMPISIPELIEIRGEIYLSNPEFERINREQESAGEPTFSNPRNLAAGTLKQHDPTEIAARHLEIVFYGWGAVTPASALPETQQQFHALIREWGLPGIDALPPLVASSGVWSAVQEIGKARPYFRFPTDGAVIKLNSVSQQHVLGTSESAPNWAVAYKFTAARVETTLLGITLQVGRTGAITPVAELAPVRLAGSTIARASLHSRDEIIRQDLRVGDTVIVEKAGEIIPAIVGVNLATRPADRAPYAIPSVCPECHSPLSTVDTGAVLYCRNSQCPAQLRRQLEHFASKGALDIKGLGPATIESLVNRGLIKTISDLYRLSSAQLESIGVSASAARKILTAIDASKHAELWRVIYGLGLPHVGVSASHQLADICGTLDAVARVTPQQLAPLGDTTAAAVMTYLSEPRHRALLADLVELGVGSNR